MINRRHALLSILILTVLSTGTYIFLSSQQETAEMPPANITQPEKTPTQTTNTSNTPPPTNTTTPPSRIHINATLNVSSGGVFAAQITYPVLKTNSTLNALDTSTARRWQWNITAGSTKQLGVVFPVDESGVFKAWLENEEETAEARYSLSPGKPALTAFLVESWTLMNNQFIDMLAPGDKVSITVEDTGKAFTITVTEEGFKVTEGTKNPDIVFIVHRQTDLMEFVTTENLGATLRTMIGQKKLAVQLRTGNLFKLSRFADIAVRLGVVDNPL